MLHPTHLLPTYSPATARLLHPTTRSVRSTPTTTRLPNTPRRYPSAVAGALGTRITAAHALLRAPPKTALFRALRLLYRTLTICGLRHHRGDTPPSCWVRAFAYFTTGGRLPRFATVYYTRLPTTAGSHATLYTHTPTRTSRLHSYRPAVCLHAPVVPVPTTTTHRAPTPTGLPHTTTPLPTWHTAFPLPRHYRRAHFAGLDRMGRGLVLWCWDSAFCCRTDRPAPTVTRVTAIRGFPLVWLRCSGHDAFSPPRRIPTPLRLCARLPHHTAPKTARLLMHDACLPGLAARHTAYHLPPFAYHPIAVDRHTRLRGRLRT